MIGFVALVFEKFPIELNFERRCLADALNSSFSHWFCGEDFPVGQDSDVTIRFK